MSTTHYEVTVRGRIGATLAGAFGDLTATPCTATTVLRGGIDQPALHGVLERIDALGLELVAVRPITPAA